MRKKVNGILLLDKHEGITSNGILQRVKYLFNAKKAGHTGSLDPIATGMLPICFGEATKFSQFLLDANKSYRVTARLGMKTNTGDIEGEVIETQSCPTLSSQQIRDALASFVGEIEQIPPMYSAIKHQGRPLYELARKGISIDRPPRKVVIYSMQFEQLENELLTFEVHCSKGTYVRTLVEDLAEYLGTVAHVVQLRRMMVSPYAHQRMYRFDELEAILKNAESDDALTSLLLPADTALQALPALKLSASAAYYIKMGQPVRANPLPQSPKVRLVSDTEQFLGVGEVLSDGRIQPIRLVV